MHQTLKRNKKELSQEQRKELLGALRGRFEKYPNRHKGLAMGCRTSQAGSEHRKTVVTQ